MAGKLDMKTVEMIKDVVSLKTSPVTIANTVRNAQEGEYSGAAIGGLSAMESFAAVAGKSFKGAAPGLVVASAANNIRQAFDERNRAGYVSDRTWISLASDTLALVGAVGVVSVGATAGGIAVAATGVIASAALGIAALAESGGDDDIAKAAAQLIEQVQDIVRQAGDELTDFFEGVGGNFEDGVEQFGNAITDVGEDVSDTVNDVARGVDDFFNPVIERLRNLFASAQSLGSPIILDLDGDGVETMSVESGVNFDHDGNGFAEQTGWVGQDDALLVLDRNGDGRINGGSELFGNQSRLVDGGLASNGFEALAVLDENADGKIDLNDSVWHELRVWQDADGDGKSASDELIGLDTLHITAIHTDYSESSLMDAEGNHHKQLGSFGRSDGTIGAASDVWFQTDETFTAATEELDVPDDVSALPDLKGFGNVHDLHQAIVRDTDGELKGLVESFVVETDPQARNILFEQILFRWTGAEESLPDSRGSEIDARKLVVLERFFGQEFAGGENPPERAAERLLESYDGMFELMYSNLMRQTHLEGLYDLISYEWDSETESIKGNLGALAGELEARFEQNVIGTDVVLREFVRSVEGFQAARDLSFEPLRHHEFFAWHVEAHDVLKAEGTVMNDVMFGTSGSDAIRAGAGDDVIDGMDGNNIILADDGNDTITTGAHDDLVYGGAGNDVIVDTTGSDTVYGGAGNDWITLNGTSSTRNRTNTVYGEEGDDTIVMTAFSRRNLLDGGAGNDLIRVARSDPFKSAYYDLSSTFIGGTGNDRMEGGAAGDTYIFNRGNGQDVISDFADHYQYATSNFRDDTLVFGAGIQPLDFSVSRLGDDMVIDIIDPDDSAATDQITIENWIKSSLDYAIERFEFSDGVVLGIDDIHALAMRGSDADDVIEGWNTPLEFDGRDGDDVIIAGIFDDVIYGGDGHDVITDAGGSDIVHGGAGDDRITLNGTSYRSNRVSSVYGEAGNDTIEVNVYSRDNRLDGGAGDDLIRADRSDPFTSARNNYASIFSGGAGNDRLEGSAAGDTYIFSRGDGQDVINDFSDHYRYSASYFRDDTLLFGTDILPSDIDIHRAGDDLVISVLDQLGNSTFERVTIESWFHSSGDYVIENFEFTNNVLFDASRLQVGGELDDVMTGTANHDLLAGSDGNDSLEGAGGNDVLFGGKGNDNLNGNSGNDILIAGQGTDFLHGGDGNDTLTGGASTNEGDFAGGVDYLYGEGGDDTLTAGSKATLLSGGDGNDTLTGGSGRFNYLLGGEGDDVLTATSDHWNTLNGDSGNDRLFGAAGNDTLNAGVGDDLLEGGAGSDSLVGGAGNDRYAFNRGGGGDRIVDYNPQDPDPVAHGVTIDSLEFGHDIAHDQLWFAREDQDLLVSVIGTADQVRVQNWYQGEAYQLDQLLAGDGQLLFNDQVDQLVQAMAAFAPPAAGELDLSAQLQTQLEPALAAAWN
ncbi:hypothetical protein TspCOW1_14620 [Thiohalobacter sp. COW1]|uniref:calcium-binding protein n=1 Tax=Thiohalobacter sp. COW1 TaxID=2795687 RepID=UPI001916AF70|nr:calcium-binding protein [Thiohalobacter sp. COW1]BCO31359.1 hypothetical protein TspCOW1_14620 [Thiohalobacter sp. COW1]